MTWYAIRTAPGAQNPRREYAVEETSLGRDMRPRGKGYRIVPSLNVNISAIERALKDAGFAHYMPVELKIIRDRKTAFTYTTRRFALLPGYVFVLDVTDWKALEGVPGVAGIVSNQGEPLAVPEADMSLLREAEAKAAVACENRLAALREAATRPTRRNIGVKYPSGSSVVVVKGPMQNRRATILGPSRDGRLRALIEGLDAMGTISLPRDAVDLVEAA